MDVHYENCLVSFIDILGFRELVKADNTEKIRAYFSVTEKVTKFWQNTRGKEKIKFVTVSDSIVVSLQIIENLSREDKISRMREFFIAISILQGELALHDIWTRGGISLGKHCARMDRNIVFGPAMIAAYDLESKVAKYPRVVLDQKLVDYIECESVHDFIHEMNSSLGESGQEWRASILYPWGPGRDEINSFRKDHPLFIDYLAQYLPREDGGSDSDKIESIVGHLVRSSKENAESYEKLRWVGDYLKMRSLGGRDKVVHRDKDEDEILSRLEMY